MPVKKVTSNKAQVTSKKEVAPKTEKAEVKVAIQKPSTKKAGGLSIPVYSLAGKETSTFNLPKEIFGLEVNKALLSQAIRVYTTNQKNMTAKTKTRGEVTASSAKVWRQKGTGRARHGSISAPIFVGGGVVFGPRTRNVRLELPKNMRKAALLTALSSKASDSEIFGLLGLEKASGKTKEMAKLANSIWQIANSQKKDTISHKQSAISMLIVTAEKQDNVVRGVRNIPGVDVLPAAQLNAYEVLKHHNLLVTKEAVEGIESRIKNPAEGEARQSRQESSEKIGKEKI